MKKKPLAAAMSATQKPVAPKVKQVPKHVSILGLGPSLDDFVNVTKRLGGKHAYCDEVWGINAVGDVINCDLIFHMDDVRIQEIRAKAQPRSNIARMLEWMKKTDVPIITSRSHPDYPTLRDFPLQDVMDFFHFNGYFNSTVAYAVAYAIYIGVEKISFFGVDFTYPNSHDAEKGRACVEFWMGVGMEKGVKMAFPQSTTLFDSIYGESMRWYGYDTVDVRVFKDDKDNLKIEFVKKDKLPTAEEIEAAYDHTKHPNPQVSGHGSEERHTS